MIIMPKVLLVLWLLGPPVVGPPGSHEWDADHSNQTRQSQWGEVTRQGSSTGEELSNFSAGACSDP